MRARAILIAVMTSLYYLQAQPSPQLTTSPQTYDDDDNGAALTLRRVDVARSVMNAYSASASASARDGIFDYISRNIPKLNDVKAIYKQILRKHTHTQSIHLKTEIYPCNFIRRLQYSLMVRRRRSHPRAYIINI